MNDVIAMHRRDLVAAVQEAVAPLVAENKALAAELAEARKPLENYLEFWTNRRIAALEAALRDVLTFADIAKPVDADALTEKVRKAWQVLGSTAERSEKQ